MNTDKTTTNELPDEIKAKLYDTLCYFSRANVTVAHGRTTVETGSYLLNEYPADYNTTEYHDIDVLSPADYARKQLLCKYGRHFGESVEPWMTRKGETK